MLNFNAVTMEDKTWVGSLLAAEPAMACEYNFATMYLWGDMFNRRIARCGDRLVMRLLEGEDVCYVYPVGSGPLAPALEEMEADARANGAPLRLICVPQVFRDNLEQEFPGRFSFESDRKAFDYLYAVDKLADLKGKKMHAKRNHINRFNENYPDWMFEPLTEANRGECLAMAGEWLARRENEAGEEEMQQLRHESGAIRDALAQFEDLGLEGGLIRAEGRVVAFAVASRLGTDCCDIHFEKAFDDIQGAYSAINRELARHIRAKHPEVNWINREDDMGLEGLRKAKLSYHPDILLEKFIAVQV